VADYYHTEGVWQKIAKSSVFENVTLAVITINAVWIAVDTDHNKADVLVNAKVHFQVIENLFCAFEWLVRLLAFRRKISAIRDPWFIFDSVLLVLMVLETWIMTLVFLAFNSSGSGLGNMSDASVLRLLRLLRLSRMARMARLFRAIPELAVMIKGMKAAFRSVVVTLTMLAIVIYTFGILFTQLLAGTATGKEYFDTVPDSMNSLLAYGIIMEDTPQVLDALGAENILYGALLMLFILLASFTVLNMLIGVMVETLRVVSFRENEQNIVTFTKDKLLRMLQTSGLDADGDQMISQAEFSALLAIPEAARALKEVDVDPVALVDLSDFIFEEKAQLAFPAFMEVVLRLRGSNMATVKDIMDLRRWLRKDIFKMHEQLEEIQRRDSRVRPRRNLSGKIDARKIFLSSQ